MRWMIWVGSALVMLLVCANAPWLAWGEGSQTGARDLKHPTWLHQTTKGHWAPKLRCANVNVSVSVAELKRDPTPWLRQRVQVSGVLHFGEPACTPSTCAATEDCCKRCRGEMVLASGVDDPFHVRLQDPLDPDAFAWSLPHCDVSTVEGGHPVIVLGSLVDKGGQLLLTEAEACDAMPQ